MKKSILLPLFLILSLNAQAESLIPDQGEGDLEISPKSVLVKDQNTPVVVYVYNNYYLRKSEIKSIQLLIEKENGKVSDYSWMIQTSFDESNNSIIINPKNMEIGTYTLVINTIYGTVKAPLIGQLVNPPVPDVTPGKPGDKYRTIIKLPEFYYYGQRVEIKLDVPAGEAYEWTVNGEKFLQTTESFVYTPYESGFYNISLKASKNGKTVSTWAGTFNVKFEKPVELSYKLGQSVKLSLAQGYSLTGCTVNSRAVSCTDSNSLTEKFQERGLTIITLDAVASSPDATMAFRRITYLIDVK